jgi:GAF domain-containing protein
VPATSRELAIAQGYQALLIVPMVREGQAIGAIIVSRAEAPFSDSQVELLKTFADQAVIAIENARLFKELEARNRALTESLEQQTATSELLKVIGRSTFDLQPVFDTLAENGVRLCAAERAHIFRFDGQLLRVVATNNASPELRAFIERNPIAPGRNSSAARAALERRTIHIHDIRNDPEYTYGGQAVDPVRTVLAIPMLRADELLGVIFIYRLEVLPFTDSQVALMETFADQAVIAIENARLFSELEARNRDLTEALEQQTATAEILGVSAARRPTSSPSSIRSSPARSACAARAWVRSIGSMASWCTSSPTATIRPRCSRSSNGCIRDLRSPTRPPAGRSSLERWRRSRTCSLTRSIRARSRSPAAGEASSPCPCSATGHPAVRSSSPEMKPGPFPTVTLSC